MTATFFISSLFDFTQTEQNLKTYKDYFNNSFKKHGYIYNLQNEQVFKVYENIIELYEGDRVCLNIGTFLVNHKAICIDENTIEYILIEE